MFWFNKAGFVTHSILLALLTLVSLSAQTKEVDVSSTYKKSIGTFFDFLVERDTTLSLEDAIKEKNSGTFNSTKLPVISNGIGSKPIWMATTVVNKSTSPAKRRISIETSWLDHINIYYLRDGVLVDEVHAGDYQPSQVAVCQNF